MSQYPYKHQQHQHPQHRRLTTAPPQSNIPRQQQRQYSHVNSVMCDICNQGPPSNLAPLHTCQICRVSVHKDCLLSRTPDRPVINWTCDTCVYSEVNNKPRPTQCLLCNHKGPEPHAMHQLYDNEKAKGGKFIGFCHTLCALMICNNKNTKGCVYGMSRGGKELDDGEELDAWVICTKEALGKNAIWVKTIKEHRKLVCAECGSNDKKNTFRIPIECDVPHPSEDLRTCKVAFHPGCARWRRNSNTCDRACVHIRNNNTMAFIACNAHSKFGAQIINDKIKGELHKIKQKKQQERKDHEEHKGRDEINFHKKTRKIASNIIGCFQNEGKSQDDILTRERNKFKMILKLSTHDFDRIWTEVLSLVSSRISENKTSKSKSSNENYRGKQDSSSHIRKHSRDEDEFTKTASKKLKYDPTLSSIPSITEKTKVPDKLSKEEESKNTSALKIPKKRKAEEPKGSDSTSSPPKGGKEPTNGTDFLRLANSPNNPWRKVLTGEELFEFGDWDTYKEITDNK